jgi:TRAP-type mannitol/chloroaromatic compound transport system substrate-binding protein
MIQVMKKYIVYVDDNYHSGDEKERYKLGEFETRDEALTACKNKVDEYFQRIEKGKYSYKELWEGYMMYGEDSFIFNDDTNNRFSAWEYAKQRCREHSA